VGKWRGDEVLVECSGGLRMSGCVYFCELRMSKKAKEGWGWVGRRALSYWVYACYARKRTALACTRDGRVYDHRAIDVNRGFWGLWRRAKCLFSYLCSTAECGTRGVIPRNIT
jgi:hypothetical protein